MLGVLEGESASYSPDGQMFHRPGQKGGFLFLGTAARRQTPLFEGLDGGRDEMVFSFYHTAYGITAPQSKGEKEHTVG